MSSGDWRPAGALPLLHTASALERPASTLAFHLRELVAADLVTQEKAGRMVRCRANYAALNEVLQFVKQKCCQGVKLPVFRSR